MNQNYHQQVPQKKSKLWLLLVLILLILLVGGFFYYKFSQKETPPIISTSSPIAQNTDNIKTVADANNYFGLNVYKQLLNTKQTDNLLISPMSLSMALTLTANGANGVTLSEMQKVLGLSNLSLAQVNQDNQAFLQSLGQNSPLPTDKTGEQPVFKIANSLWADKKYQFLNDFQKIAKDNYQAESRSLDFKDAKSVDIINNWVSDKTNQKIPKILDELKSKLYLVNAIYFKSSWEIPFEPEATKTENFYLENGTTKQVPLMDQSGSYNYYEDNNLQVVSLPYLGGKYSMVVFLPSKGTKIADFISGFSWDKYASYIAKQKSLPGQIKLPKFKIEFGDDIVKDLKNIGLVDATSEQADFSKMSDTSMMIGQVIHKTFIDTDEKGTEAAAATAVGMMATSSGGERPKPFEMIVDHPFFFTVEDSQTHEIIFMGSVKKP